MTTGNPMNQQGKFMRMLDEIPVVPTLIVFSAIAFDLISFSVLTLGLVCVIPERVF